MKKSIKIGKRTISEDHPVYFIAEIGHNHQGSLDTAIEMIRVAAKSGVAAVKLQKRENKHLYTEAMYNKPYDSENAYGSTYGAHREYLEFGKEEYQKLKQVAEEEGVDFLSTPFDIPSVDFLEDIGVPAYKVASGDITNTPLLRYIAGLGKPMIISTGASNIDEVKRAYDTVLPINDQVVFLHCTAGYPTDYPDLNLRNIETLRQELPDALVGYSGHDNGILAAVIAHMLGAVVVEKHFTLNRAWKGTDHKFSLEPEGLRKQVRDLNRVKIALGQMEKRLHEFEKDARMKMGKSLYAASDLPAGTTLTEKHIAVKSPAGGLAPYLIDDVVGKKLKVALKKEDQIQLDHLE